MDADDALEIGAARVLARAGISLDLDWAEPLREDAAPRARGAASSLALGWDAQRARLSLTLEPLEATTLIGWVLPADVLEAAAWWASAWCGIVAARLGPWVAIQQCGARGPGADVAQVHAAHGIAIDSVDSVHYGVARF